MEHTLRRADIPVDGCVAGFGPRARAFAPLFRDPSAGRGPLRLRESRGVSGREWRRVSRLAECAEASLHRAAGDPQEAGRSARDDAPRRRAARAAGLRDGGAAEEHRVLDRAARLRIENCFGGRRGSTGRPAQCISAGHADHRLRHSAQHVVRASGIGGADLGDARGLRRLRVHPQPPGHPARARAGGAVALRLREPGAALHSARPARSARSALRGEGVATRAAVAGDHARAGVLPVHQLRADESTLRAAAGRAGISHAAAGLGAEECTARRIPHDARMRCCSRRRRSGRASTCRANS